MTHKLTLHKDQIDQVIGRQVTKAVTRGAQQLTLQFAGGVDLSIKWRPEGLLIQTSTPGTDSATGPDAAHRPTKRQLDYLLFIRRYMTRYGRAPAESDIERHFLVSAPSVNQMMQMLERRGFITRQPGVPRSARLCIDLDSQT